MRFRILLWFAAFFAFSGSAFAGSVGVREVQLTTPIYSFNLQQQAGQTWNISTSNLSAGGDTVIHVQDDSDPQGGFIAGNDDSGGLQSFVTVPPSGVSRLLRVVVRAYSQSSPGTCTITATSSDGQNLSWDGIEFGGVDLVLFGAVGQGTRIQTAELPGGNGDTVMLVIDNANPARAVAWDDDDGVAYMSWLRLGTQCAAAGCFVMLGKYSALHPAGPVRIVWDEDAEKIDFDQDGDGLSGTLEASLFTDPNKADSDSDGINDNIELVGVDTASGSVKFAALGADPLQKDLFVEADWVNCAGCSNADAYQMTLAQAAEYPSYFLPVRLHLDIGVNNPDPNTRTSFGEFGGANRVDAHQNCLGFWSARQGYFHHLLLDSSGSSGFGACGSSGAWVRYGAHEMGHMLGLQHGGSGLVTDLNWKPNYRSIMNYAYEYDAAVAPKFSSGNSPIAALDPRAMNERDTRVGGDSVWRQSLSKYWGLKVDAANGWVDWNRDGEFAPAGTTVRAAPAHPVFSDKTSIDENNADVFGGTIFDRTKPQGVMFQNLVVTTLTAPVNDSPRLYLFGTDTSNKLFYNFISEATLKQRCSATGFSATVGSHSNPYGNCAKFGSPSSTGITSIYAPAVVQRPGTSGRFLVITVQADGKLHASFMTVVVGGNTSWSDGGTLPGNIVVDGPPAAAVLDATGGLAAQIRVYAPSGGRLKAWSFATSNSTWSNPWDEHWSTSATDFIAPTASIGVTRGIMTVTGAQSQPKIFAVIPHGARFDSGTGQTLAAGHVRFAGYDWSAGAWIDLGGVVFPHPTVGPRPAKTTKRPGVAYMPFGTDANVGRFYVGWSDDQASMTMTEGNNRSGSATSRRFKWLERWTIAGNYYSGTDGVSLFFDPAADSNLRMAFTTPTVGQNFGAGIFGPMADGVIAAQVGDLDDYTYITGMLRASLGLEPRPLP